MNRAKAIEVIREKLKSGNQSVGSWIQIPNSSIAEIMGCSGYDWVAVDMEHGSMSLHQLPDIFRALELGNTLPLVRISEGNSKDCKEALDAGAGGVIVPMSILLKKKEISFILNNSKAKLLFFYQGDQTLNIVKEALAGVKESPEIIQSILIENQELKQKIAIITKSE